MARDVKNEKKYDFVGCWQIFRFNSMEILMLQLINVINRTGSSLLIFLIIIFFNIEPPSTSWSNELNGISNSLRIFSKNGYPLCDSHLDLNFNLTLNLNAVRYRHFCLSVASESPIFFNYLFFSRWLSLKIWFRRSHSCSCKRKD